MGNHRISINTFCSNHLIFLAEYACPVWKRSIVSEKHEAVLRNTYHLIATCVFYQQPTPHCQQPRPHCQQPRPHCFEQLSQDDICNLQWTPPVHWTTPSITQVKFKMKFKKYLPRISPAPNNILGKTQIQVLHGKAWCYPLFNRHWNALLLKSFLLG